MILNAVVLQSLKEPKDNVILIPTGPNNILVLGEVLKVSSWAIQLKFGYIAISYNANIIIKM